MGISGPILVLVVSFTNIIVGKLILGEKRRKVTETRGKYIEICGLTLIALIGFGSLFVIDIYNPNVMKWFWLCFLILTVGFQSFLEWKFLNDSKEYVVSLITLLIGLIYILVFIF